MLSRVEIKTIKKVANIILLGICIFFCFAADEKESYIYPVETFVESSILEPLSEEQVTTTGFFSAKDQNNVPLKAIEYQIKYGNLGGVFLAPVNKVYLTFDIGYDSGLTEQYINILNDKNVHAVFFITGQYYETSKEQIAKILASGHTIGNHTYKHLNYPAVDFIRGLNDIFSLHNQMKSDFGYEMQLFRFPRGYFSEKWLRFVTEQKYTSVFWSYETRDWDVNNQPAVDKSIRYSVNAVCPGMIYLYHTVSKSTLEALPDIIDGIRSKGFEFGEPKDLILPIFKK